MSDLPIEKIGIAVACLLFIIKMLMDLIGNLINKISPSGKILTDEDLKEIEFKTDLKNILKEMRKTGENTQKVVYENQHLLTGMSDQHERTHKYTHELEEHVRDIVGVIKNVKMCKEPNA